MKQFLSLSNSIRIISLLLVLAILFSTPQKTSASCAEPGDPEAALDTSDAVFSGAVVYISSANGLWIDGITRVLLSIGFHLSDFYDKFLFGRRIVFEVDRAWKGVETSSVMIRTGYSTGDSSGYPFELGSYYLVYASHAYGDPEKYLLTSLCHRTMRSPNNSEDISYLNNVPTLELRYFPAIIRTIDGSLVFATLFLIGSIYILYRRIK